uniref:CSON008723 protein n=1 Tax=Culicoides sonorensis TaxID=179676 RepID=A0A336M1S9_CULSO
MKSLAIFCACILAVSGIDFDKVRPIEDLLAQYPEKYPLFSSINRIPSGEVILGAQNIRENEPSQVYYKVPKSNIKFHEQWSTSSSANDIAIIKLPSPIVYNDRIRPINLPSRNDRDNSYAQENGTVTSGISPELRYVETEIITNNACASYFPGLIKSSNICASGRGGKGSCSGDSGGPMTVEDQGKIKQVGIVSFGIALGCTVGFPHVYTRVTEYFDWIQDNSNVIIENIMNSILIIFACILAVNAVDFDNVKPIQDLLALYPEKYPLFNSFARIPSAEGRIVGGLEAVPGQFPFQAALFVAATGGNYFCGGTIINNEYILTAAHCVDEALSVEVVLGAHNVRENESSQKIYEVPITNIKVHEQWNPSQIINDIALLKVLTPIVYNDRIRPITLPRRKDRDNSFAQEVCLSTSTGISPVLRFVETQIITNSACGTYFPGVIKSSNICASGRGGKSVCSGDSGGPLTVEDEGQTKQVGVTSFVIALGCSVGFPHAYTRVTEYLDWIEANSNVVIEP